MKKTRSVADYIAKAPGWERELGELRGIIQSTGLTETIKWGAPCYTHNGKNVVGMAAFSGYFGLWFYQGALLQDTNNKLINAQEGKTKALRQWRMTRASDIKPTIIKRYIRESVANLDDGREIRPVRKKTVVVPGELRQLLSADKPLKLAFGALSPGRQREYAEYIAEARRTATRDSRLKKITPMILAGQGLNDRYRKR